VRWRWPLPGVDRSEWPRPSGHPGAFGTERRFDVHTGVDLYCPPDSLVVAVEPGEVVSIEPFTGARAESPWWNDTSAVLVEGASGVVCYGELVPDSALRIGSRLEVGATIGRVQTVLKHDKGRPTSMLHLELYAPGTKHSAWWRLGSPRPIELRDPSSLLLAAE
jgi:hypothetical protein